MLEEAKRKPFYGNNFWSGLYSISVDLSPLKQVSLMFRQFGYFEEFNLLRFNVIFHHVKWEQSLLLDLYSLVNKLSRKININMGWTYLADFPSNSSDRILNRQGYLIGMIARKVEKYFRTEIDAASNKFLMRYLLTASDIISREKSFKGPYILYGASFKLPNVTYGDYKYLSADILPGYMRR